MAEMLRISLPESSSILMLVGDITEQQTDAIVNAANSSLMGGSGVDGAIHLAGGPAIVAECKKIVDQHGPLSPGDAVATTAGTMKAGYVIHTVGPIYKNDESGAAKVLARAYTTSLAVAEQMRLHSVAFPAISTGAYGYPPALAAPVAINATIEALHKAQHVHEVRFVFFHESMYKVFANAAEQIARETKSLNLRKLQGLLNDHA
jgi:O-acetyl-ADP-ribose deacetylase (regulator of RNase III)